MCKKALRDGMTYVDQATEWAKELTRSEARGPGDMENAWRRLEARYGVPWRVFWQLRYRKPSDMLVTVYARLQLAYAAECERQMRRLEHETRVARQLSVDLTTTDADVVANPSPAQSLSEDVEG